MYFVTVLMTEELEKETQLSLYPYSQYNYIFLKLQVVIFYAKVVAKFKGQPSVIYDLDTYQEEQLLVGCGRDKLVKVFDTRTMKLVRSLRGHNNTISCIRVNQTHRQVSVVTAIRLSYHRNVFKRRKLHNFSKLPADSTVVRVLAFRTGGWVRFHVESYQRL